MIAMISGIWEGKGLRLLNNLRKEAGALWILALMLLAGALNAAGFLQFGQTLSHMTGNLTKMGLNIALGKPLWLMVSVLLSFLLGATLSGYAFPRHSAGQWRRSGLVLSACGAALLLGGTLSLPDWAAVPVTALVLGAQNGLAMRYRGILARTTHITGHLTDLGAALGRMVQARRFVGEDARAFLFHLSGLLAFLLGVAMMGAYAARAGSQPDNSPVAVCGFYYLLFGLLTLAGTWLSGRR